MTETVKSVKSGTWETSLADALPYPGIITNPEEGLAFGSGVSRFSEKLVGSLDVPEISFCG